MTAHVSMRRTDAVLVVYMRMLALVLTLSQDLPDFKLVSALRSNLRVCIPASGQPLSLGIPYADASGNGSFSYILAKGGLECIQAVRNGSVHLAALHEFDVYLATMRGFVPVVVEGKSYEESFELSVTVVKSQICDAHPRIEELHGLRSCHSSYQGAAGWWVPLGLLAKPDQATISSMYAQGLKSRGLEVFTRFFSQMCAPMGVEASEHLDDEGKHVEVCTACPDNCTASSPYLGDGGALRCVLEDVGDVAFLSHKGVQALVRNNRTAAEKLRLLCPQGGCVPLDQYRHCHVAKFPPWALMALPQEAVDPNHQLQQALKELDPWGVEVLRGRKVSEATYLTHLPRGRNYSDFIDEQLMRYYKAAEELQELQVSFCNVGIREQAFCERIARLLNGKQLGAHFWCIMEQTIQDCVLKIAAGNATVRNMAIGEAYGAHKHHHLKAIVGERFSGGKDVLYAVAVVRREFCSDGRVGFSALKGKAMCSTGYLRPAGWHMPVGFMIGSGIIPVVSERPDVMDDAESVASFFGKVCAAGAEDNGPINTPDGYGKVGPQLCSACKGDCSTEDPYFTYKGAFRCLMEGAGDVAFCGHHTPLRFASDGLTPASWSQESKDKFRLLCPRGGCAVLDDYHHCHLGRVPGRALMTSATYPYSSELQHLLLMASEDADFRALVFNVSSNPDDLVLRAVAVDLVAINDDTLAYLGPGVDRLRAMEMLRGNDKVVIRQRVARSGPHLTTGEFSGVVVCTAIFGMLVGMLGCWGWLAVGRMRQNRGRVLGDAMGTVTGVVGETRCEAKAPEGG